MIPDRNFSPDVLATRLVELFSMDSTLAMAARCAARVGMPEATVRLADVVAGVIGANGDGARDPLREQAA
jgi:ATP-dependent protease ClpP protease subunit